MSFAAIGLAMSAASAVVGIMQASAQAKAIKAQGEAEAQLARLQALREKQSLESQSIVMRAQATLETKQAELTGLEGQFARLQRRDEANGALQSALERVAAINAGSAAGMVDLGHTPTDRALLVGYEDFATATEAGDIQFAAKKIQEQTQLTGADLMGFQADTMDADGNYLVNTALPYQQAVIRSNASNQAKIVRQSGVAKAFGTIAGGAFKTQQLGGWDALKLS
jgi:hypothetical protein